MKARCRLCLRINSKTHEILKDLSGLIDRHLSVKVDINEARICQRCLNHTLNFNTFYEQVQEAQIKLNVTELQSPEVILIKVESDYRENAPKDHPLYEPAMETGGGGGILADNKDVVIFNTTVESTVAKSTPPNIEVQTSIIARPTKSKRKETPISISSSSNNSNATMLSAGEQEKNDIEMIELNLQNQDSDKTHEHQLVVEGITGNGRIKLRKFNKSDEELIKEHIKMVCEICTFVAVDFNELTKHFSEMHPNYSDGPYIKCCGKILRKQGNIILHAYKHEDPEYFKCPECNKLLSNRETLNYHYITKHGPKDALKHACDHCERRFPSARLLEIHKGYHVPEEERKFVCTQCPEPRTFGDKRILQMHIQMRHVKTPNVCHICAKVINSKYSFEKHVRAHMGNSGPRLKCPIPGCDSWLKDDENLKIHVRRHKIDAAGNTYKCNECDRVWKSYRLLRIHQTGMHSTKRYDCQECGKTFKKAVTLKEHVAGHTGEALYNCPFCTRTFHSKGTLFSHRKSKHGEEWARICQLRKDGALEAEK